MDATDGAAFGGWWFALSLVNAGLAEGKGRSRLTWWFVSLFIGPLATFLIVAWAPVDNLRN
jgi:hypothetical protein